MTKERRLSNHPSAWVRGFACEDLRPLIICRGPVRKEVMDIFEEMGIHGYGILLSEKDSISYDTALAPELRKLSDPQRVHRVPDYTGADSQERERLIRKIIAIAREHAYNAIFAGYGFMAEDWNLVSAVERAGLLFIGPSSGIVQKAGFKDEAKRVALAAGVSIIPGVDNAAALTLLAKYPDTAALYRLARRKKLQLPVAQNSKISPAELAELLLTAAGAKGIALFSTEELGLEIQRQVRLLFAQEPSRPLRLKAVGGGGGKGQRILEPPTGYPGTARQQLNAALAPVPAKVQEALVEAGASGPGAGRNLLIESDIRGISHQEIQLVGNGDWCIALGGRDCSLQMHEQKLLELSMADETYAEEIARARDASQRAAAAALGRERRNLARMEQEAEAFGRAVGLDSVSTFECIVDAKKHFFMEMNTRIQVEHRVTELCYGLRFENPQVPGESFTVDSLVETMVLLAVHGAALPPPKRVPLHSAAAEARLNATDDALAPHAGGIVEYWSDPVPGEIRDDQGIGLRNPDTGAFIRYRLAGAYDSNIALLLATGESRADGLERLAQILQKSRLRGDELATNLDFHRGVLAWLLAQNANARIVTHFAQCYLAAVGRLYLDAQKIDLEHAWQHVSLAWRKKGEQGAAWDESLAAKRLLILRALGGLLQRPHLLAGWLSRSRQFFRRNRSRIKILKNPIEIIEDIYSYLGMKEVPGAAASEQIWSHDRELLERGLSFYQELERRLEAGNFLALERRLARAEKPAGFSESLWERTRAAHSGFQCGTEILSLLPLLGELTDFYGLQVRPNLEIKIPARFTDKAFQEKMRKVLSPRPQMHGGDVVAESGGMFYLREAPQLPPLVNPGQHVKAGDLLYIVEVMKMFNKVYAPFAGTVEEIVAPKDGAVIKKGQLLFRMQPDSKMKIVPEEEQAAERKKYTEICLKKLGIG